MGYQFGCPIPKKETTRNLRTSGLTIASIVQSIKVARFFFLSLLYPKERNKRRARQFWSVYGIHARARHFYGPPFWTSFYLFFLFSQRVFMCVCVCSSSTRGGSTRCCTSTRSSWRRCTRVRICDGCSTTWPTARSRRSPRCAARASIRTSTVRIPEVSRFSKYFGTVVAWMERISQILVKDVAEFVHR